MCWRQSAQLVAVHGRSCGLASMRRRLTLIRHEWRTARSAMRRSAKGSASAVLPFQHGHLHASIMVKGNADRCHRKIVLLLVGLALQ